MIWLRSGWRIILELHTKPFQNGNAAWLCPISDWLCPLRRYCMYVETWLIPHYRRHHTPIPAQSSYSFFYYLIILRNWTSAIFFQIVINRITQHKPVITNRHIATQQYNNKRTTNYYVLMFSCPQKKYYKLFYICDILIFPLLSPILEGQRELKSIDYSP